MVRFSIRLSLALLVHAAVLSAQSTGITTIGSWRHVPTLHPSRSGMVRFESVDTKHTGQPGIFEVNYSGQATSSSPFRIRSASLDENNNTMQHLPYFDQVTWDHDTRVSVDEQRILAAIYNTGVTSIVTRPNPLMNWTGRTAVTGLVPNFSVSQVFTENGRTTIVGTATAPNTGVWWYDLNVQTKVASNGRRKGPTLTPGDYFQFGATMRDPISRRAHGSFAMARQPVSFNALLYYNSSPTMDGPWIPVTNAPSNCVLTSMCVFRGGTVFFNNQGPFPFSQFPDGVVSLDCNAVGDRQVDAAGGPYTLDVACPGTDIAGPAVGLLGLGFDAPPTVFPNFLGACGLGLNQVLSYPLQVVTSTGLMSWSGQAPPLPVGSRFKVLGVVVGINGSRPNAFTDTANVDFR